MAAFNTHTLPSEAEPPHTKLIDSRWLELIMAKLADVDNLNEKKKKLGGRKPLPTSDVEAAAAKAAAKKGQKGKATKEEEKVGIGQQRPTLRVESHQFDGRLGYKRCGR